MEEQKNDMNSSINSNENKARSQYKVLCMNLDNLPNVSKKFKF